MTTLPVKTHLTSSTTTEGQFQTAIGQLWDFINELATAGSPEAHILSGDRFTPTRGYVVIEPEGTPAIDNCSNILPTTLGEKILFLTIKAGKTITLRHNVSGSGKLSLRGSADVVMTDSNQLICLRYLALTDTWYEAFRNWGVYTPSTADKAAALTALGITEIATRSVGVGATQIPAIENLGALALRATVAASHIESNAVIEAKILNGAVSIAKLKNSTVNTLIGFSNTGAPVNVVAGSGVAIDNGVISASSGSGMQLYKTAGTFEFTVPAGVTQLKCWAIGGGGGGNGINLSSSSPTNGGTGGNSSIGTFFTAYGGNSNVSGGGSLVGSQTAIAASFKWQGGNGDAGNPQTMQGGMPVFMGQLGPGDIASFSPSINYIGQGGKWPGGGAAGFTRSGYTNGRGAGSGGTILGFLTVTPGQVIEIIVGAGGTSGGGSYGLGRPGAHGLVLIEW